jgi:hypothetical protein
MQSSTSLFSQPCLLLRRVQAHWQALDTAWRWALTLFLGYRVLFSVWAAWVSSVFPYYQHEAALSIWPGTMPLALWGRRAFLWPFVRYDVIWYLGIATHGYAYRVGSTAFHPLYPLLVGLLGRLIGGHFLLAAWLIAQACCIGMLVVLYRLVLLDDDVGVARRTTLFLLGSPLGFAFLLPYTESLLMLCIVGAFYAARRGRWGMAGIAGAGAALTKQPGVVVLLPLLWELWRQQRENLRARRLAPLLRPALSLTLIPIALFGFLLYRATLNDVAFAWRNPGSLVSALLVTPTYRDVWGEYFSWPWASVELAVTRLRTAPYFYLLLNTFLMLIMIALLCASLPRQRRSYAIYSCLLLLLNLAIVYPPWPYMGIVRRFTIIFPLFIQLARWGRGRGIAGCILACNTLLWVFIGEAYVRNSFVP